MLQKSYWRHETFPAMIGLKPVAILASLHLSEANCSSNVDAQVVLFRYEGRKNIYALRWSLGAVINMDTKDIDEAVGGIEVMRSLEASRNAV